MIDYF